MIVIDNKNITRKENISVRFFYEKTKELFKLKALTNEAGMDSIIPDQNLHRPGLALAGFVDLFSHNRIQVIGNTEIRYLLKLTKAERAEALARLFNMEIPCVIITENNDMPEELLESALQNNTAVFISQLPTTKLMYLLSDFLDDQFAPRLSLHGSFVDVYGVGILFMGKSGIGKSEVALDLVERGHRLVADDVVILTKKGEGILLGSGTEIAQHFMEIRGIGIIDVRSMFGIRAIRFQKRLEIIVKLENWDDEGDYTRTGLNYSSLNVMDVDIPFVKLPIIPGKNITVISEVIALNYLLKHYGYDAAKVMSERLSMKIKQKTDELKRNIDYFEHDFE